MNLTLDACMANGPVLVAKEISNYLRRVAIAMGYSADLRGAEGLELERVFHKGDHVERVPASAVKAADERECYSIYFRTEKLGAVWIVDVPTLGAAQFVIESLGTLWRLPVVNNIQP